MKTFAPVDARMSFLATSLWISLLSCACSGGPRPVLDDEEKEAATDNVVERLAERLSGRFDSTAQAARDPRYFGVSLRACPFDLVELGSHVLYVEQAMVDALDAPYRQRVYLLSETDAGPTSEVYELTRPDDFIGLCDDASVARPLASEVVLKEGCTVHLSEEGDAFLGGTVGQGCESTRSGAAYATSEVTITPTQIRTWDRGYDASDVQVWGAEAGPYEFDRKE